MVITRYFNEMEEFKSFFPLISLPLFSKRKRASSKIFPTVQWGNLGENKWLRLYRQIKEIWWGKKATNRERRSINVVEEHFRSCKNKLKWCQAGHWNTFGGLEEFRDKLNRCNVPLARREQSSTQTLDVQSVARVCSACWWAYSPLVNSILD